MGTEVLGNEKKWAEQAGEHALSLALRLDRSTFPFQLSDEDLGFTQEHGLAIAYARSDGFVFHGAVNGWLANYDGVTALLVNGKVYDEAQVNAAAQQFQDLFGGRDPEKYRKFLVKDDITDLFCSIAAPDKTVIERLAETSLKVRLSLEKNASGDVLPVVECDRGNSFEFVENDQFCGLGLVIPLD